MAKPRVRRTSEARNDLLKSLPGSAKRTQAAVRMSATIGDKLDLLARFPCMGEQCEDYAPPASAISGRQFRPLLPPARPGD